MISTVISSFVYVSSSHLSVSFSAHVRCTIPISHQLNLIFMYFRTSLPQVTPASAAISRKLYSYASLGPNRITNEFYKIWEAFIPFPYQQTFRRGAYFAVEVVPNALAVISLNTLYFYDANDGVYFRMNQVEVFSLSDSLSWEAVGGCSYNEPNDPGNLQFTWLEDQLISYRERQMQVRSKVNSLTLYHSKMIFIGMDNRSCSTLKLLPRMCRSFRRKSCGFKTDCSSMYGMFSWP